MSADEHRRPLLEQGADSDSDSNDSAGGARISSSLEHAAGNTVRADAALETSGFRDPLGAVGGPAIVVEEPPPSYSASKWSNPRPMSDLLLDPDDREPGPSVEEDAVGQSDPFASLREGPRTVVLTRDGNGYGFTVGGNRPVHVAGVTRDSPAAHKGLKVGDQILEINGVELLRATLADVSSRIQNAATTMTMVVVPGNGTRTNVNPWQAALMALENGTELDPDGIEIAIDPTQRPPDNLRAALCSCLCCPLVAFAAIWHSRQVRRAWNAGLYNRSRAHAIMSKKLSSSAVLYGVLIIVFYLFVQLGKDEKNMHNPG